MRDTPQMGDAAKFAWLDKFRLLPLEVFSIKLLVYYYWTVLLVRR
jgi:hypothetical protein